MLSSLWWLPLLVAAAAILPLWRAALRLVDEGRALHAVIEQLAAVRPRLAEVRAQIAAVAAAQRRLADFGPRYTDSR